MTLHPLSLGTTIYLHVHIKHLSLDLFNEGSTFDVRAIAQFREGDARRASVFKYNAGTSTRGSFCIARALIVSEATYGRDPIKSVCCDQILTGAEKKSNLLLCFNPRAGAYNVAAAYPTPFLRASSTKLSNGPRISFVNLRFNTPMSAP